MVGYRGITPILLLFVQIQFAALVGAQQGGTPQYSLVFNIPRPDPAKLTTEISVSINADLPGGEGFTFLALPFSLRDADRILIEPGSDANLVLYGDLPSPQRLSVVVIRLAAAPTKVNLSVRAARLLLSDASQAESGRAIVLPISGAFTDARIALPDATLATLTSMRFESDAIDQLSVETIGFRTSRTVPVNGVPQKDIIVYLRGSPPLTVLYYLVFIGGALVGIWTAPRYSLGQKSATILAFLSIAGLLGWLASFFGLLTPEQRTYDMTTVSLMGIVCGGLAGLTAYALFTLWRHHALRTPAPS